LNNSTIIKPESIIKLNKFVPREYQLPVCRAFEEKTHRKFLIVNPRRSGKDYCWFSLMIREAVRREGLYMYCLPTFSQARSVIWEGKSNTGSNFLDQLPKELIAKIRNDTMTINLTNGSIIRLVGSDSYDTSIVGSNPRMIVFSEYALCDENAYKLAALPILRANDGIVALISTPRGKNHMYELYQIAKNSPDWFVQFLTIEDTGHISAHEVRREIESGEISEDLAQQEYYCSFEMGQEGSYYAKYIDKMRIKGQIGLVPWEPYHKVSTSWDLGVKDPTCIIFFQVIGQIVRIIDYYEASDHGMDHFANVVLNKPYSYGYHFPPHDIMARESGRGLTKKEMYKELGIKFTEPVMIDIEDGIELCRRSFNKIWIDEGNCKKLIKALENYREEFDVRRKVYKGRPLHDWASHACFTGDTKILTRSGMRQIMDVEENDEVLTLSGWKKCTKAFKTRKNVQLVEVKFSDGTIVKCTPDHLFLTTNGWKSAKDLTKGSRIQSSLTNSLNILMDLCIVYGRMRDIYLKAEKDSIEQCGKMLSAQYQKIVTYITETVTPLTTISGISNVYQPQSISNFLGLITKDLAIALETRLLNGIAQRPVAYGIKDMLKEAKDGKNGQDEQQSASSVNVAMRRLYAEMGSLRNSATQTAKPLSIGSVKMIHREDVWDITVPEIGHFSLENGAIVHNSDAFRYMCAALPKTKDGLSAKELDQRYRDVMLGDQAGLPSVFRTDLPDY